MPGPRAMTLPVPIAEGVGCRPWRGLMRLGALGLLAAVATACGGAQFDRDPTAGRFGPLPGSTDITVAARVAELPQPATVLGTLRLKRTSEPTPREEAIDELSSSAARYGCDALAEVRMDQPVQQNVVRRREILPGGAIRWTDEVETKVEFQWTARCVRTAHAAAAAAEAGQQTDKAAPAPTGSDPAAAATAAAQRAKAATAAADKARTAADAAERDRKRLAVDSLEKARLATESTDKARARQAAEAAEKARVAAETAEAARATLDAAEKERKRAVAEAAEKAKSLEEFKDRERQRAAAEIVARDRARAAAEAQEKARVIAEAAEKAWVAAEADKARAREAAEADKVRSRQAAEADAAEKQRLRAADAAERERARTAAGAEKDRQRADAEAAERERQRAAAEAVDRAKAAAETADRAKAAAEAAERDRARAAAEAAERERQRAEAARKPVEATPAPAPVRPDAASKPAAEPNAAAQGASALQEALDQAIRDGSPQAWLDFITAFPDTAEAQAGQDELKKAAVLGSADWVVAEPPAVCPIEVERGPTVDPAAIQHELALAGATSYKFLTPKDYAIRYALRNPTRHPVVLEATLPGGKVTRALAPGQGATGTQTVACSPHGAVTKVKSGDVLEFHFECNAESTARVAGVWPLKRELAADRRALEPELPLEVMAKVLAAVPGSRLADAWLSQLEDQLRKRSEEIVAVNGRLAVFGRTVPGKQTAVVASFRSTLGRDVTVVFDVGTGRDERLLVPRGAQAELRLNVLAGAVPELRVRSLLPRLRSLDWLVGRWLFQGVQIAVLPTDRGSVALFVVTVQDGAPLLIPLQVQVDAAGVVAQGTLPGTAVRSLLGGKAPACASCPVRFAARLADQDQFVVGGGRVMPVELTVEGVRGVVRFAAAY